MINPLKLPSQIDSRTYNNPETNRPDTRENAFKGFGKVKQDRYNDIYSHELAHQRTAGAQGGGITIETDANGVAFAGHVPIQMPSAVNKANPSESLEKAQVAYDSALAPSDPSGQDLSVASRAQSIMSQARAAQNNPIFGNKTEVNQNNPQKGKKLNFLA
jgi:hypothetical protein